MSTAHGSRGWVWKRGPRGPGATVGPASRPRPGGARELNVWAENRVHTLYYIGKASIDLHLNKSCKYNATAVRFLLPIMCVPDAARAGGEVLPSVQNLKKTSMEGGGK